MPLSSTKVDELKAAIADLEEHYAKRLTAVDREVRNLKERGSPLTDLGDAAVEGATVDAVATLTSLGVEVAS